MQADVSPTVQKFDTSSKKDSCNLQNVRHRPTRSKKCSSLNKMILVRYLETCQWHKNLAKEDDAADSNSQLSLRVGRALTANKTKILPTGHSYSTYLLLCAET